MTPRKSTADTQPHDDGESPDGLGGGPTASRFEAFRALAQARARGEMVFLPRHLTGHERRRHVRQTIREDHETRIANKDEEAVAKFDKLHKSVFSFFRGTCLLFYRDMAGEDAWMPTVLTLGDVHPENFGVMPSVDNVPIFGPNDFDESFYAPFTWDLKRGATAFMIGAGAEGGKGRKKQRKIAASFVRGYIDAMEQLAADSSEQFQQMRQDNAPKLIRKLIENSMEDRSHWLARKYHDEYSWGFRADDEHVPITHRVTEFQGRWSDSSRTKVSRYRTAPASLRSRMCANGSDRAPHRWACRGTTSRWRVLVRTAPTTSSSSSSMRVDLPWTV